MKHRFNFFQAMYRNNAVFYMSEFATGESRNCCLKTQF